MIGAMLVFVAPPVPEMLGVIPGPLPVVLMTVGALGIVMGALGRAGNTQLTSVNYEMSDVEMASGAAGPDLSVVWSIKDRITDEIGAIQGDLLRSLELSDLFEMPVSTSHIFWDRWIEFCDRVELFPKEPSVADRTQLVALANTVQTEWDVALANAEKMRLSYLEPATRVEATRAVNLIRRGTDERTPVPERELLMERAARILADLNLAHLPEASRKMISDWLGNSSIEARKGAA